MKIETITFIRGWRENFFKKKLLSYFFLKIFKKSNQFIVLSKKFKEELKIYFKTKKISILYTTYDKAQIIPKVVDFEKGYIKLLIYINELKGIIELLESVKQFSRMKRPCFRYLWTLRK